MRNAVLVLAALVLSAPAAGAQTESWANKMFARGGTSHDFGSIPRGTQLFHRFTITNIYAVPMQVTGTRTSCGCVTVTPPVQALQPREEAAVEVLMDSRRFTGPKTVSIFVTVGPQFTSTATLTVAANCRADVVCNPGEVNFGVVPRGQAPSQVIDVEYAGVLDWRVTEVVPTSAPLQAAVEELYRRPGQVGYRVKVTLQPDAPAGPLKQELFLKTNDPASKLVPVLVEATVQAPLAVVPAAVNLGAVKPGELLTRRVVVRGSQPFRLLGAEGQGDGLEVELPPGTAAVQIVTLRFRPGKPGALKRQLLFKTDLDQSATATLAVEGTVAP